MFQRLQKFASDSLNFLNSKAHQAAEIVKDNADKVVAGCCAVAATVAAAFKGTAAMAQTTSSVPDIGVDLSGYATDMGTKIGLIIVGVIGVGLAVFMAKWGYKALKAWLAGS